MNLKLIYVTIALCISSFLFNSCSEDSSSTNPTDNSGKISVTSRTVSGKIKKHKLELDGSYSMIDWPYGAAELTLRTSVSDILATCQISASGDFSIVLPAEVATSHFSDYYTLLTGLTIVPANSKSTGTCYLVVKYNESGISLEKNLKMYTFKDTKYKTSEILTYNEWECFMNDAKISGTAPYSGMIYNISATKGWNIVQSGKNANSIMAYQVVSTLPADVVFHI